MNVLDLFSGVGGFSLGLERAGMRTSAFCEIQPFCRSVLAKHWPSIHCYTDIRELTADRLVADRAPVDLITAGFPCQDISSAGAKTGIGGERSGLWREVARLIGELRPRYVVLENVSALLARGLGEVLGDLATLGFDAEWHCISAAAVGADHERDRVWIIGYSNRDCESRFAIDAAASRSASNVSDAESWLGPLGRYLAGARRDRQLDEGSPWDRPASDQPDFLGVADGLPARMDRLRALGNSLVPQIPEIIGRAIMHELSV